MILVSSTWLFDTCKSPVPTSSHQGTFEFLKDISELNELIEQRMP